MFGALKSSRNVSMRRTDSARNEDIGEQWL